MTPAAFEACLLELVDPATSSERRADVIMMLYSLARASIHGLLFALDVNPAEQLAREQLETVYLLLAERLGKDDPA